MEEKSPVYLVMVTTNNNNKYYRMIPHGDTFEAEYGRVGASCQHASYSMSQWNKKYNEKIKKGYVDQTHLVQDLIQKEKPKGKDGYKEIENKVIAEIVQRLQDMAHQKIQANYKVSSQNVNDYLSRSKEDFARILKDEQDLLDVMRGQVVTHTVQDEPDTDDVEEKQETIIEAMGLEFEQVTQAMVDEAQKVIDKLMQREEVEDFNNTLLELFSVIPRKMGEVTEDDVRMIKSLLGDCRDKFYRAWRVKNIKTQKRFDEFVNKEHISKTKLLWHGSRNENWWSIINTGLVLRPTNAVITGKMFGFGIYYAPKARKSLGYTSLSGSYWARGNSNSAFMALMDVAYGKPYDVHSFDSKYYDFNYERLQKTCPGANCLHAHAGSMLRNDEIIVYKEDQCTIKYLVELR